MTETPAVALVERVATTELPEFPAAMEHLVAAGLFSAAGELLLSGRNYYRPHEQGYEFDYFHAEQGLLERYEGDHSADVDLVVTLEPCDERNDGLPSCSERIVTLASKLRIRRVVAGCLDDGLGVRILAGANIKVDVLVGPALHSGRNIGDHLLDKLRRDIKANGWGDRVRLLETPSIDPVNQASNTRYSAMLTRIKDTTDRVLRAACNAPDAPALVAAQGDLFPASVIPELEKKLSERDGTERDGALLRPIVHRNVRRADQVARDRRIIDEVRARMSG